MPAELVNGVSVLKADDGRAFALINGEAFLPRAMVAQMLADARAEGARKERERLLLWSASAVPGRSEGVVFDRGFNAALGQLAAVAALRNEQREDGHAGEGT